VREDQHGDQTLPAKTTAEKPQLGGCAAMGEKAQINTLPSKA